MASDFMRRERKGEKRFWICVVVYFWSTEERQPLGLDMGRKWSATCQATALESAHKVLGLRRLFDRRSLTDTAVLHHLPRGDTSQLRQ